jgi:hypothetical protein
MSLLLRMWDVEKGAPLFKTGQMTIGAGPFSSDNGVLRVFISGGEYLAVPFDNEVRVYHRQSGNNYRYLISPSRIPDGSLLIWSHWVNYIIAALEQDIVLFDVEERREIILTIEGALHQLLTKHQDLKTAF